MNEPFSTADLAADTIASGQKGKTIHERMIEASRIIGAVGKARVPEHQRYKFRAFDDVVASVHRAFSEVGIHLTVIVQDLRQTEVTSKSGTTGYHTLVEVLFQFSDPSGRTAHSKVWGESVDYGDKGVTKAMTQAMKYALTQTLVIPTKEDEPDAHSPEVRPSSPSTPSDVVPRQDNSDDLERVYEIVEWIGSVSDRLDDNQLAVLRKWKEDRGLTSLRGMTRDQAEELQEIIQEFIG